MGCVVVHSHLIRVNRHNIQMPNINLIAGSHGSIPQLICMTWSHCALCLVGVYSISPSHAINNICRMCAKSQMSYQASNIYIFISG